MARPFIPAPQTASIELMYTNGSLQAENIFHVRSDHSFSSDDFSTIVPVLLGWYTTFWRGSLNSNWSWARLRMKALDTVTSPMYDEMLAPPQPGTAGGVGLPANVTLCMKMVTATPGRSSRGRWYTVGMGSGQITSGSSATVGYRDFVRNGLLELMGQLASNDYIMCVTSFRHDKEWRDEAVNYDITNVIAVDLFLDSQRRRLIGRGVS